jgi:hypothetical protein
MNAKARCAPGEVGVGLRIACVLLLPFLYNNSISKVEKAKYTVQTPKWDPLLSIGSAENFPFLGQTLFFTDARYQDAGVPGLFLKPSILGFENAFLQRPPRFSPMRRLFSKSQHLPVPSVNRFNEYFPKMRLVVERGKSARGCLVAPRQSRQLSVLRTLGSKSFLPPSTSSHQSLSFFFFNI